MARDIDEFLRKAAERRNKAAGGAPPAQPGRGTPVNKPPTPARTRPRAPEIVEPDEVEVVGGEGIAKRHLDTSRIAQHAAQLGAEVGLADDKIESRLQEKFDHDLGRLTKKKKEKQQRDTGGSELLKLLRTPKTIRQAIIVTEILKRPNFD